MSAITKSLAPPPSSKAKIEAKIREAKQEQPVATKPPLPFNTLSSNNTLSFDMYLDGRSETAQKLHTYIIGTIKGKEHLDPQKVKEIIRENPNSLLELSINNCSHLQDIIHIGAEHKLDSDLIRKNAHCLFQEIRHFFPKKMGEVLLNRTKDGFTLLQSAVTNGNKNIISMVMSWYQDAGLLESDEFKKTILLNRTEKKFNLLHHIGLSGLPIDTVKNIIQKISDKDLSVLLNETTQYNHLPGISKNKEIYTLFKSERKRLNDQLRQQYLRNNTSKNDKKLKLYSLKKH